jgi:hypothetical protein
LPTLDGFRLSPLFFGQDFFFTLTANGLGIGEGRAFEKRQLKFNTKVS